MPEEHPEGPNACIEDTMLDEKQQEDLLKSLIKIRSMPISDLDQEKKKRRKKRNSKVIGDFQINRWTMPIKYKIDGYLRKWLHQINIW